MPKRTCAVEGCDLEATRRGWCQAHYRRWKRFGDVRAHIPLKGHRPEGFAWCSQCSKLKPLAEFQPNPGRPNGVNAYCKLCEARLRATKYRQRIYAQKKRWHDRNPGKATAYSRGWRHRHPERARAKRIRQRAANPARWKQYDRAREANRRRRFATAKGRCTTAQLVARWAYYGNRCWMCREPATVTDHVKPLSKGGSKWPANLRPACISCNSTKHATWPYPLEVARAHRAAHREGARGSGAEHRPPQRL